MGMRHRPLVLLGLLAAATACGSDGAGSEPGGAPAVTVTLQQYRADEVAHQIGIQALADSKKTYEFQVTIEVDGTEASISVGPDPADEPTLFGPVEVACGLG